MSLLLQKEFHVFMPKSLIPSCYVCSLTQNIMRLTFLSLSGLSTWHNEKQENVFFWGFLQPRNRDREDHRRNFRGPPGQILADEETAAHTQLSKAQDRAS